MCLNHFASEMLRQITSERCMIRPAISNIENSLRHDSMVSAPK
jgi:hypothetical protein